MVVEVDKALIKGKIQEWQQQDQYQLPGLQWLYIDF